MADVNQGDKTITIDNDLDIENVNDSGLDIKGRAPRRANSRYRRNEILQATLRIIARDGIRAVRHRAIAKEADVPLSATTYYFKDIKDLISDAFGLFIEQSLNRNAWLQEQSLLLYQSITEETNKEETNQKNTPSQIKARFIQEIPELLLEHIQRQVEDQEARRLEHAFLNETLHSHILEERYKTLRTQVLTAIEKFLILMGNDSPQADAHSLHGIIQWLEYLLVVENQPENWQLAQTTLERHIQRLFSPLL